jgi:hypothetical protein
MKRRDVLACEDRDDPATAGKKLANAGQIVAHAKAGTMALYDTLAACDAPLGDDLAMAIDIADSTRGAVANAADALCAHRFFANVNEVEGCPVLNGLLSSAPPVELSHNYPFGSLKPAIPVRLRASASGHPNA